jgi:hypothetical protein
MIMLAQSRNGSLFVQLLANKDGYVVKTESDTREFSGCTKGAAQAVSHFDALRNFYRNFAENTLNVC